MRPESVHFPTRYSLHDSTMRFHKKRAQTMFLSSPSLFGQAGWERLLLQARQ